jgi:uncharacterized protein (DUF2252 family)
MAKTLVRLEEDAVMDPIALIRDYNAGRDPDRLAMKLRAMRASPSAFLRGSCHLFYRRLPRDGVFKTAPQVWCCGDLHLENFGSYKGDNGLVYFDINDFDESALAPASWDLVRLLCSLRVAAQGLKVEAADAEDLCRQLLQAYGTALALGKAYWTERDTAQGPIHALLDGLRDRERPRFLDSRTSLSRGLRTLDTGGKRALPASPAQRERVTAFMQGFAIKQPEPNFFEVLDVARRIAGTGSLGVDRYVVLVQGKGSPEGNYLLDLKETLPSSMAARLKLPQPAWPTEANRVVAVQQRMQAVPMAFLHAVRLDKTACVLRALQPSEDRIDLGSVHRTPASLVQLVGDLGRIVAWAQLRSAGREGAAGLEALIDFGPRRRWKTELLEASQHAAQQVADDAAAYNRAFDKGAFEV